MVRKQRTVASVFRLFFIYAFIVVVAFPLLNMIITSLTGERELFGEVGSKMLWIPKEIRWDNFVRAMTFKNMNFVRAFKNTMIILCWNVFFGVASSAFVAYGFGVLNFPGKRFLFLLLLGTMMLPQQVKLVPTFVIWSKLRLVDTFAPLCVGSLFGLPYYIFLIRQFMMGVPREYMDAAKIDGANNYSIFFRIALPQMVPVLTAIGVLQIIGQWKNLLGPVIYLRSAAKFTLAMELNKFQQMTRLTEFSGVPLTNLLMAASIVLMIPMLIVFIAGQKHFMKGLDISAGLKG